MMATSTFLMVTAGWLMPSTQAVSHGAGHSRPVNSGKLLVACSRSIGLGPVLAPDQVVPLRDQVAERAAVVAEGDAAVHAAAGLLLDERQQDARRVDLVPVLDALVDGAAHGVLDGGVEETTRVSHVRPP